MSGRAELLTAWAAWERSPSKRVPAVELERQVQGYAHRLGMSPTELRLVMQEGRRSGLSREAALAEAEGPI